MFEPKVINNKGQYQEYLSERFIYREELEEIFRIMKTNSNYRILIFGPAGSGKTTLLHMLCNYTENNLPIDIVSAYKIEVGEYKFTQKQIDNSLFVDGIDECQNPYQILQQLENQKNRRLICTSRINLPNNYFTHTIELKPLTLDQIINLKKQFGIEGSLSPVLLSGLSARTITPKDILSSLISNIENLDDFYSKYPNLVYQFGNGIDFSSGIIVPQKELITPSKQITTSITVVNDTLLKQAKQDPRIMYKFSPREFELMVCELLDKQGYNVKLTKQTRDGGKDIIIVEKSLLGEFCIYVECKKYNADNPISVQLVRELYGTVEAEDATAGMLITTSYFTKDAREFTQKVKHRMALRDYNDLVQQLNNIKY